MKQLLVAKLAKYGLSAAVVMSLQCFALAAVASGANNHYLPLKTDPIIELKLEQLVSLSKMPAISKPYNIATIRRYLPKIRESHPGLYREISDYLKRYQANYGVTQASVGLAYSNSDTKVLPNSRGINADTYARAHLNSFASLGENITFNFGGTVSTEGNFIPHNTYLSLSSEYAQLDLGYKEVWLSPYQESAMLLSTQAKPVARVSLSSPRPISKWNIRYDLSYGKLEEMDGIRLEDTRSSGRPGFLTTHITAQFLPNWTLGGSRTMMFGGGERQITNTQIWKAFLNPMDGDNCGGDSKLQDCTKETGNQQAAITSKVDFTWGMPMSVYIEVSAEDANSHSNMKLGNLARNLGVFFPQLSDRSTLLIEATSMDNAWYSHHLYEEGYRNDGEIMGHWWGEEKNQGDGIGGAVVSSRYTRKIHNRYQLEAKGSVYQFHYKGKYEQQGAPTYDRAYDLSLSLTHLRRSGNISYSAFMGTTPLNDDFFHISVGYSWR